MKQERRFPLLMAMGSGELGLYPLLRLRCLDYAQVFMTESLQVSPPACPIESGNGRHLCVQLDNEQ